MTVTGGTGGQADVEILASGEQADAGIDLELKEVEGRSVAELSTQQAQAGHAVFRTYGGPGGLHEEFEQIAADHPDITATSPGWAPCTVPRYSA